MKQVNNGTGCKHGDIIELRGASGSGKTMMMIHAVVHCLLPLTLGGCEKGAVWFDNDGQFSILNVKTMLKAKIIEGKARREVAVERSTKTITLNEDGKIFADSRNSENGNSEEDDNLESIIPSKQSKESSVEEILRECLERLYVISCSSSTQFVFSLYHTLPSLMQGLLKFRLVVVDNVGSFNAQEALLPSAGCYSEDIIHKFSVLVKMYPLTALLAKPVISEMSGKANSKVYSRWSAISNYSFDLQAPQPRYGDSDTLHTCTNVNSKNSSCFTISSEGVAAVPLPA
jgi:hypothetical protein